MFANSSKILQKLVKNSSNTFATIKTGNLYCWGSYTSGTGFELSNTDSTVNVPKLVDQFNGNVAKVVMGPYHTAIITGNGELWTMGCGKYGALGIEKAESSTYQPQKVSFFSEQNLKVTDAALGEHHSIFTTENGEVWSCGYSGNNETPFFNWMCPITGGLGSGEQTHRIVPGKVEGVSKPKSLASGDRFVIAVSESGDVMNWGCGADGSLADGLCEGVLSPRVNDNFKLLKDHEKLTIKEIKSASHFSVALMSDGNLYAWGRNNQGSMGIRENLGHNTDEIAYLPTKVVNNAFKDEKIVDFSVGENSLVILTDKNKVYWSGLDLAYKPINWSVPANQKITKVVASKDCFAALSEDGTVYTFRDFIENARHEVGTDYSVAKKTLFGNQNVFDLGGSYGIRYAIAN